tara:strand:+ start:144 stop:479 length:336 start_codon:yes stop_codon:yes gene_type:complete
MSELKIESNVSVKRVKYPHSKYVETFDKMQFGNSVFFKNKKDAYSFYNCLREYVRRNHIKLGVNTHIVKNENQQYEYWKWFPFAKVRKVENGYRVWLINGEEEYYNKKKYK